MAIDPVLSALARDNPWPDLPDPREAEPFTFALDGGGRDLVTDLIRTHDIRCMVEVGCFLGGSARQWLEASDRLIVIGVDPWLDEWGGSLAQMLTIQPRPDWLQGVELERYARLVERYGTYRIALNNLRAFKDRFIPVRRAAPAAYRYLKKAGVKPGLVYIDAMKQRREFWDAHKLFPDAVLAGDDWTWPDRRGRFPVRDHIYEIARARNAVSVTSSAATWLIREERLDPPRPIYGRVESVQPPAVARPHSPMRMVIDPATLRSQSLRPAGEGDRFAGGRLPAGAVGMVTTGEVPHQRLISPDIPFANPAGTHYRVRFRVLPGDGVTTVGIRLTFERKASRFIDVDVVPGRWQTVAVALDAPIDHTYLLLFLYPATTAQDQDGRPDLRMALAHIELSPQEEVARTPAPAPAAPLPADDLALARSKRPIFIVGCGHSGTSLLAAMMDSHHGIMAYPGESYAFHGDDWESRLGLLVSLAKTAEERGIRRICEKTPSHVHDVDRIRRVFPDAPVLYVVRDGRDVACSVAKRTGDLADGVAMWIAENTAGLAMMRRHGGVMQVRYEDLVADSRGVLERVCAFVGEPFDERMLSHHTVQRTWFGIGTLAAVRRVFEKGISLAERERRHRTRRNWQINQPLFDGRGEWLDLPADRRDWLNEQLGPLLRELGYD
ncbi:sulfotransferase [Azospirillum sp.]|uniref:sulfotransferase family protein n=1 Tax=Azospirillum sp. TaxID=34012 RepID=UPI002D6AF273|nr:sulfotransferase [Azospirillum sp.]HYD63883.1 sulfotransferase [Azospirillum sp.]